MPGDDSAKTCCISKNCHLRFENGKRRKKYVISTKKFRQVSKNELFQQKYAESVKYAVSAKFDGSAKMPGDDSSKTCCISKIAIFGLKMAKEGIGVCK